MVAIKLNSLKLGELTNFALIFVLRGSFEQLVPSLHLKFSVVN